LEDRHIPLADLHMRLETVEVGPHSRLVDRHTEQEIDWALVRLMEALAEEAYHHIEGSKQMASLDIRQSERSEGCNLEGIRRILAAMEPYPYPTIQS
jgi:hypothetical protein